ncbi:uncharacterized protein LOC143900847 [Temnothorax americanus]
MRQYMCQNVAQNFTAVKQVPGKSIFKGTDFYKCIEAAVSTRFKKDDNPLTERQFKQAIQAVLNNVKDWNGKRTKRRENAKDATATPERNTATPERNTATPEHNTAMPERNSAEEDSTDYTDE